MVETIVTGERLPIIGGHEDHLRPSRCFRSRYQATACRASKILPTRRQTVLPGGRRVVDGVHSERPCGLLVCHSVKATSDCGVLEQVRGPSCVSGSRDTAPDDSSACGLGKAAWVQLGRIRHNGQHTECEQFNFLWLQALCSRGAVFVRTSIVLEEGVVIAIQRRCGKKTKTQTVFAGLVSKEPRDPHRQNPYSQSPRTPEVDRVQSGTKMFSLRDTTPCGDRLPSRYQRRQEVGERTCQTG